MFVEGNFLPMIKGYQKSVLLIIMVHRTNHLTLLLGISFLRVEFLRLIQDKEVNNMIMVKSGTTI